MNQINPGQLDKHIKIYENPDDEEAYYSCHAQVANQSGSQTLRNGGELNSVKTRFLIRYTTKQITTDMEIAFNGRRYPIIYVNDYNFSHQYIEIFTGEIDWSSSDG